MGDNLKKHQSGIGTAKTSKTLAFDDILQANRQLQKLNEQYQFILEATQTGTWEWNVQTGETSYNEQWANILGYTLNELEPVSIETWKKFTHPDDLKIAQQELDKYFKHETPLYQSEFRMKHRSGKWIWILDKGRVAEWTSDGKPLRMLGTHQSINQRKEYELNLINEEARLESLLKISQFSADSTQKLLDFALDEAIQLTGSKLGYIYFYNDEKKEFVLNTWSKEVMKECHVIEPQTIYQLEKTGIWGEAVRQGKPIVVNNFNAPNPLKKGLPTGHAPLHKFLTIPVFSEAKIVAVVGVANKTEDYSKGDIRQLTLMMDTVWKIFQHKEAEQKLQKASRLYAVISQVNQAIVHNPDRQKLLEEICRLSIEFGKFRMAWIGIPNPETLEVHAIASAGHIDDYLSNIHQISTNKEQGGSGPVGTAIRENRIFVCNDIATDPAMKIWREEALKRGFRSVIGLPLRLFGQAIAALAIYSDQINFFNSDEIKLLEEVTYDINHAIDAIETEIERKKNEEELIKLSRAAEQNPTNIVITDLKGRIEYVNPKFTEITGYTFEEALGQNPRILKTGYTSKEEYKTLWNTIANGKDWKGVFRNKRKNGELYWEKALISPIKNQQGKIINYLAIKEDITQQRLDQEALMQSEAKLKEALATKDKFFSIISHDLRSPIGTLVNFTGLLADDQAQFSIDEYQQYARAINKTAQTTFNLLENLLEWSRLQQGSIQFKPISIDLEIFLHQFIEAVESVARNKGIDFSIHVQGKFEIIADQNMLNSTLRNLVSNAIKFTKMGGSVSLDVATNHVCEIIFSVSDNGIGMDLRQLNMLFKLNEDVSRPGTNGEPSTGLGLILCKEFVEMHGGKIWAESKEGLGSKFCFTIPNKNK
ncbi:MAG: GAF domain-containing protein [Prolixibacteraceae bacterium]|nr:GAF domain-containing protein [Prolixibacteraceae bacterium]